MSHDRNSTLDSAVATFLRFGFRKTSMEEVARAAGLSRQALYLGWSSKEELFVAAVGHVLDGSLAAARDALEAPGAVEDRLIAAFDAAHGPFVGHEGEHLDELLAESGRRLQGRMDEWESKFDGLIAAALAEAGMAEPTEVAAVLVAASTGLKHGCGDRPAYRDRLAKAVRLICAGGRVQ